MGPRSDERGNVIPFIQIPYNLTKLQWGRAQMSAEMRSLRGASRKPGGHASMGPRSDERGNSGRRLRGRSRSVMLQWGRAQMSAEMAR